MPRHWNLPMWLAIKKSQRMTTKAIMRMKIKRRPMAAGRTEMEIREEVEAKVETRVEVEARTAAKTRVETRMEADITTPAKAV